MSYIELEAWPPSQPAYGTETIKPVDKIVGREMSM